MKAKGFESASKSMVRRTKDEAEKTRDAILNAAEKVFYKHGVGRSTLEQVAAAAKVTRGAVYWHFKDKAALCEEMMMRIFQPYEEIMAQMNDSDSKTPLDDIQASCLSAFDELSRDKRRQKVLTILFYRCEYVGDLAAMMEHKRTCKDDMWDQSVRLFERARKFKQLSPNWTPQHAATILSALMNGLMMAALEGRKEADLKKGAHECLRSFFRTLYA